MKRINLRIRQISGCYTVEYYTRNWYGKKIWKPYITHTGLNDKAYYFKNPNNALNEAAIEIKRELSEQEI